VKTSPCLGHQARVGAWPHGVAGDADELAEGLAPYQRGDDVERRGQGSAAGDAERTPTSANVRAGLVHIAA
jgi:hypothetical protein